MIDPDDPDDPIDPVAAAAVFLLSERISGVSPVIFYVLWVMFEKKKVCTTLPLIDPTKHELLNFLARLDSWRKINKNS